MPAVIDFINDNKPQEAWHVILRDDAEKSHTAITASTDIHLTSLHHFSSAIRAFLSQENADIDKLLAFLFAFNKPQHAQAYAGVFIGLLRQLQHHPQASQYIETLIIAMEQQQQSVLLQIACTLWKSKKEASSVFNELLAQLRANHIDVVIKAIFVATLSSKGAEYAAQLFWRIINEALKSVDSLPLDTLNRLLLAIPEEHFDTVIQQFLVVMPNGISVFPNLLTHYLHQRAAQALVTTTLPAIYCHLIMAHIVIHDTPQAEGEATDLSYFAQLFFDNQAYFTEADIKMIVALLAQEFDFSQNSIDIDDFYIALFIQYNYHAELVADNTFSPASLLLLTLVNHFHKVALLPKYVAVLTSPAHATMLLSRMQSKLDQVQCLAVITSHPAVSADECQTMCMQVLPVQIMMLLRTLVDAVSTSWPCVATHVHDEAHIIKVMRRFDAVLCKPELALTQEFIAASAFNTQVWELVVVFLQKLINSSTLSVYAKQNLALCLPPGKIQAYATHVTLAAHCDMPGDNYLDPFNRACVNAAYGIQQCGIQMTWQHLQALAGKEPLHSQLAAHHILETMQENSHLPIEVQLLLLEQASTIIDNDTLEYQAWLLALKKACHRHLTAALLVNGLISTLEEIENKQSQALCGALFIALRDNGDVIAIFQSQAMLTLLANREARLILTCYTRAYQRHSAQEWHTESQGTHDDVDFVESEESQHVSSLSTAGALFHGQSMLDLQAELRELQKEDEQQGLYKLEEEDEVKGSSSTTPSPTNG